MKDIFLSYRRSDSSTITGRIHDHLLLKFGPDRLFKDVDSIPAGQDFRHVVIDAVASCKVFIAVIGDNWLEAKEADGRRRIDDPNDYVHIEVAAALARDIPVIPVLVDKATLPTVDQLPAALSHLPHRQAIHVRPDPDFRQDMQRLCAELAQHVPTKGAGAFRAIAWSAATVLVLLAVTVFALSGSHLPWGADPCDERYASLLFVPEEKIAGFTPAKSFPETSENRQAAPSADGAAHLRIINQTGRPIRVWRFFPDSPNEPAIVTRDAPDQPSSKVQSWRSIQVCGSSSDNLKAIGGWSFIYVEDLKFSLTQAGRGVPMDHWFMPTELGWVYIPFGKDSEITLKPNFFDDPTQFIAPRP